MKAQDLRIGNYVRCYDVNVTVSSIRISYIENESDDGGQYNLLDVEPILLTEEWLLKFGWICQPWGWVLHEILIRFTRTNSKNKYWIELGNGKRIDIPYVHTLQNFFALTGNELTI